MASYREGFSDCAREVAKYLGTTGVMNSINGGEMLCQLSARLKDVASIAYCSRLQKYVTCCSSSSVSSSSSSSSSSSFSSSGVQQLGSSACLETPMESSTPVKRLAKHRRRLFQPMPNKASSARKTSFVFHSPGGVAPNNARRGSSSKNANRSSSCSYSYSSSAEIVRPFVQLNERTAFDELDINGNRREGKQIDLAPVDNSDNSGAVWRPW